MAYYFVTPEFKNEMKINVIGEMFPALNGSHQDILLEYLVQIIDDISIRFCFDVTNNKNIYEHQFRQNGYRDSNGLVLQLLPFIDDDDNNKKKELQNFDQLYIKKDKDSVQDINDGLPKYYYTNLEYGRCARSGNNSDIVASEISFNKDHLHHNFILLRDTIQTISNKLYVNWIDIRPVSLISYKDTGLYKNTDEAIINGTLVYYDPNIIDMNQDTSDNLYKGLYIGDIYNTISNDFYHSIKNIKWLIYDVWHRADSTTFKLKNLMQILVKIGLPLNPAINDLSWNQLSNDDRETFINKWKSLVQSYINSESFEKYSAETINGLLKSIIFFFNKYYNDLSRAEADGYIKLKGLKERKVENLETVEDIPYDSSVYFTSAKSISPEHLYEYLRDSLLILKNTAYSSHLMMKDNNGNYKFETGTSIDEVTREVKIHTSKNLYNYAKSLTHQQEGTNKYREFPRLWRGLNKKDRDTVIDRLNWNKYDGKDVTTWFYIKRYIRQIHDVSSDRKITEINNTIYQSITDDLCDHVFNAMVRSGALSQFIPDKRLSDMSNYPKDSNAASDMRSDNLDKLVLSNDDLKKEWENSYYFINGEKYTDQKITVESPPGSGKTETKNYIETLGSDKSQTWYTTYAMNWISQIAFFHKYLNNRVIYVTGSTGVGKSTQIPKLLLYSLKILDYKYKGSVICTQPRIPPTFNNTKRIAKEMGVPIEEYNESQKRTISTDNYYVQYQHSKSQHKSNKQPYNLEMTTDGLLYQKLKDNPILKVKRKDDYLDNNIYDIVIVDEAHEHNANMDLILTIMKNGLYYNNDLKLVIISATMEEDEPTYRRYYREINDNKMYPFNFTVIDHNLDRVNVDRRLHIGESTRYTIDEYYEPGPDSIDFSVDFSVDLTLKVANTTNSGDILLFKPGKVEISNAIEQLNKSLPSNFIALPYHGEMSQYKKDFIEDINDDIKKNLVIPRDAPFESNYENMIKLGEIKPVPKGTYDRIVIVATNLAEASITIPSLKYVIDPGNQKIGRYDYKSRGIVIVGTTISESSRIQRRGRVGRVAPGTVYYLYEKGAMKDNRTVYNISVSDISDNLYDLLQNNADEKPLINPAYDPNKISSINYANINNIYPNGISKMIEKQYIYNTVFLNYEGNLSHYDYQNNKAPHLYYQTGYNKETLVDSKGDFYIIHPDELLFNRNILGIIISTSEGSEESGVKMKKPPHKFEIESQKINSFFNILVEKIFLMIDPITGNLIKTEYGININGMHRKLNKEEGIDVRTTITYAYSRKYKNDDQIAKFIPMLLLLNGSLTAMLIYEDKKFKIDKIKNIYGNCVGDTTGIIEIINRFLTFINNNVVSLGNAYSKSNMTSNKQYLSDQKELYLKGKVTDDWKKMEYNTLEKFIQMDNNGQISELATVSNEEFKRYYENDMPVSSIKDQLSKHKDKIAEWCYKNYLNSATMMKYINNYITYINNIFKLEYDMHERDYDKKEETDLLNWFDNHLQIHYGPYDNNGNPEDKLTLSLLHGYSSNIALNIEGSQLYLPIYNPAPEYVCTIKRIVPKAPIKETLLKDTCKTEYLLYLSLDRKYDEMSLIHNINPEIIQNIVPYTYAPSKYLPANYDIGTYQKAIDHLVSLMNMDPDKRDERKTELSNTMVNDYMKTVKKIRIDMLNNYTPNVWRTISKLDSSDKYKKSIERQIVYQQKVKREMPNMVYDNQSGGSAPFTNYKKLNNIYVRYLYSKLR